MRLVIADTGPVNYLVLIGQIDLLPALFDKVILPSAVRAELTTALAEQAQLDRAFDSALEALQNAEAIGAA